MNKDDREQFASSMMLMCSTFQIQADRPMLDGYWIALEDMPIEAVCYAMRSAMFSMAKFPRPYELRQLAGCGDRVLAEDAWSDVLKQIESVGSYGIPTLHQVTKEAVVRCGGWRRLCGCTSDDLHNWVRKQFIEAFEAQAQKAKKLIGRETNKQLGEHVGAALLKIAGGDSDD